MTPFQQLRAMRQVLAELIELWELGYQPHEALRTLERAKELLDTEPTE